MVEILLRVTVLLLAAALVASVLRRSSAALRHLVWTLSLAGTLLIPLCAWLLPAWQWAVLPQRQAAAMPAIAAVPLPANAPVADDRPPARRLHAKYSPRSIDATSPLPAATADRAVIAPTAPPTLIAENSATTHAPQPWWSWSPLFAAVWALGTSLGLAWIAIGLAVAWRVARRARPLANSCWHDLVEQLIIPCGVCLPTEVRECPEVSVPMTWGLRRPVILVPSGSAAWSEPVKRSVLLHELGHVRRSDCVMLLLGRLACAAYWFHPLVWLAVRQMRKTSEQAADDLVLAAKIAPPDYAGHLVGIAAQLRGLRLFGRVALPMAGRSDLESRVRAILDPKRNHRSLKRKTCYASIGVFALLLIPCAIVRVGYAGETTKAEAPSTQQKSAAMERKDEPNPANAETATAGSSQPAAPLLTALGKVVDPAGEPVTGAAVYLRERLNDDLARELRNQDMNDILATTQTGEQGTFRFENIRARPFINDRDRRSKRKIVPWDVVVIAKPYAIAWQHLTDEQQSKPMTFKLSPDATIAGRVTDEKGRAMPNADARVLEIRSLSPSYVCLPEQAGSDPETLELQYSRLAPVGKTDAQGKVLIAGLPRGVMLEVRVGHGDSNPQSLHVATTDKPQPKLEGFLGYAIDMETRTMTGETTFESVYSMEFSMKLGPPLARFAGRITAADSKKPLPQTLVDGCGTSSDPFTVVDRDGRFVLKWLRPRNRYLWIKAPDGSDYLDQFLVFDLPKEKEFDLPKETKGVPLDIELTRGEILTGTVSDVETGKGLAGFGVSFDNRSTRKHVDGGEPVLYRAKTDNAGRFRLAVPPGKGNILISRPGDDPGWEFDGKSEEELSGKETVRKVEVLAGKPRADLTLKIHHSRNVEGKVVDPHGRPAAGADVGLSSWFSDNDEDFHPVQTDAQGRFAFRRIPDHSPLNPTDTVIAIDRERRLRGHVQVPNDSPAASKEDVLTIRLVPTGVVRGRVLQGEKPISGAFVNLNSMTAYDPYSTQTDPSGQFEFPMVEACSEMEFGVQASGQHTYLRRPTSVLSDRTLTREKGPGPVVGGHTLELKPFIFATDFKSVGGVVTDPNGKPVEGLEVWVFTRSDNHKLEVQAQTGNDGRFCINQVPNVPLTLVTFKTPTNRNLDLADFSLARKDAEPGQMDVRIVFDPKQAKGKKEKGHD